MISVFGNEATGVAYATGFVTLVVLIFGEITPKSIASDKSEAIVPGVDIETPFYELKVPRLAIPVLVGTIQPLYHIVIQLLLSNYDAGILQVK